LIRTALLSFLIAYTAAAAESKACAPCHAEIYRKYMMTAMARTSGPAAAGMTAGAVTHGTAEYHVFSDRTGLWFDFRDGEISGRRRLNIFVGSGVVGRSYATNVDGFLYQAPISYYSEPAQWKLSPGYERASGLNLTREIELGCLNCHATRLNPIAGTSNGYGQPPFAEAGVGCERCHGASDDHIARMKSGKRGAGTGIVNPAKLDHARRDSVCAQCHLPGAVEIARAVRHRPYAPGDRLADSVAVFVVENADHETTVNGHFEQLARSACLRQSSGKLWCGACHDPHSSVPQADSAAFYRKRCFTCHSSSSCKAPAARRASAQDNCVTCHMPKRAAETVQHAALTDHSIPRRPHEASRTEIPNDVSLVPFAGFEAGERDLGLAYATIALRDNNAVWGRRAVDLLRKAVADSPDDGKAASRLAQLYDHMGRDKEACSLYAQAVAADKLDTAAAVNLGTCFANDGKLAESMRLWTGALERNPALESARLNIAVARYREGDASAARAILQQGLKFNPASRGIRQLLREMER
jgi:hypothetical protein